MKGFNYVASMLKANKTLVGVYFNKNFELNDIIFNALRHSKVKYYNGEENIYNDKFKCSIEVLGSNEELNS